MSTQIAWMVLPAAVALDLMVGDPHGWPHPVRWMGAAIARLEPRARRLPLPLTASGAILTLGLVAGTWTLSATLLLVLGWMHPTLPVIVEVLLIAWTLSVRSLYEAGITVHRAFSSGGLQAARLAVAMIVGRETAHLDREGVSRAAVESVAENLVDGVISPLFFAALGGAPLAMAFKMVNTLDSMIGYRNERYEQFGKIAARLDDAANFLPARLSVSIIAVAARLLGADAAAVMRLAWQEGRHATSPNAGYPEAAFAAGLGVRLGGPAVYHGVAVEKPYIGGRHAPARPEDIPRACALMVITSLLSALAAMGARSLI